MQKSLCKRGRVLLAVMALAAGLCQSAFGAEDLAVRAECRDVEGAVGTIREMYAKTNSGGYAVRGAQWFHSNVYGDQVVKAAVSNGDAALDRVMKENGYQSYSIEYYYDNPDCGGKYVSGSNGPNFAFAVIDGKEYRYYFSGSSMIRRIGPDGTAADNPETNGFLNILYQAGCRYQNDLSVCSGRSLNQETIVFGYSYYDMGDHMELYARTFGGDEAEECGLYVVDSATKLGPEIQRERTWREGDDAYTWLNRHLRTDASDGGYMPSLECFQVNTTGGHVDYIEGIYATH